MTDELRGRGVLLAEGVAGLVASVAGLALGVAHYRVTHHMSGVVVALCGAAVSGSLIATAIMWARVGDRTRRWARRGGHLIAIALLLVVAADSLEFADLSDVPLGGAGGGTPAGAAPLRRRRAVRVFAGIVMMLVGAVVGAAEGDSLTRHAEWGVLIGILVGVAVPGLITWGLVRALPNSSAPTTALDEVLLDMERQRASAVIVVSHAAGLYRISMLMGRLVDATGPDVRGDTAVVDAIALSPSDVVIRINGGATISTSASVTRPLGDLISAGLAERRGRGAANVPTTSSA